MSTHPNPKHLTLENGQTEILDLSDDNCELIIQYQHKSGTGNIDQLPIREIGSKTIERGPHSDRERLYDELVSYLDEDEQSSGILIVTVTKVEAQAVLEVFSQAAGQKWTRLMIGNKTYYDLGIHGGVPVFMVQSEMGTTVPGGALLTVRQAIQDLQPQAVIMCGIAFGLRPDKQQLGDILVARQLLCYEPQKMDLQQGHLPRGDRITSAERLLDRFRSGDNDWRGAQTHFGLVLSGEKLVNNPTFRDRLLKTEPEAVGGEMEGAGLYAAAREAKVDWILVKAICDWADGRKSDYTQARAASNAAQFVLYVLRLGGWERFEQVLRKLCLEYTIDYDSLVGKTPKAKARTLVDYRERHESLYNREEAINQLHSKPPVSRELRGEFVEPKSISNSLPSTFPKTRDPINEAVFDVFLAHNSQDNLAVKAIASKLKRHRLRPWLDEDQIPPGRSFQDVIQEAILKVKSAAIFIGPKGVGKWEVEELRAVISQCVKKGIPVIPVLLPGVDDIPESFLFLDERNCVRFSGGIDDREALKRLVWGIRGGHLSRH